MEFKRNMDKYIVIKGTDLHHALREGLLSAQDMVVLQKITSQAAALREIQGKLPLRAVVVEEDWPEYELVWAMLEKRTVDSYLRSEIKKILDSNLMYPEPVLDNIMQILRQGATLKGKETQNG